MDLYIKKIVFVFGVLILSCTIGVYSGSVINATSSNVVFASCEQDECEGGDHCQDNAGQETTCSFTGSECVTGGCSGDDEEEVSWWPW